MILQTLLYRSGFSKHWLPALRRRHGDVIPLKLFPEKDVVLLADREQIRTVFSGPATTYHAGEGKLILTPILGEHSVMLADEDPHMRLRKLLMPAFGGAELRGYRELIANVADNEVATWPSGATFPLHPRIQRLTLEVVLRVVFGLKDGARLTELRTLLTKLIDIGPVLLMGLHNPKLHRFQPWKSHLRTQARVDELLHNEIADRRRAVDLDARADVLSTLLKENAKATGGDAFSDTEIRDNLITLLLAGHESTATALAWAFHDLARDPAQLDAATKAADSGDEAYLEAVAKETMRLNPIVFEVGRKATQDVEVAGYRIPAGHTIYISIALVQADAGLYPEPERFRPERFLGDGPVPGSWLAFGGGLRRCLGMSFALVESIEVLRAVLSRHHLVPDRPKPEPPVARNVCMAPKRGTSLSITPR
jgi:cytochrome P450